MKVLIGQKVNIKPSKVGKPFPEGCNEKTVFETVCFDSTFGSDGVWVIQGTGMFGEEYVGYRPESDLTVIN